MRIQKKVKIGNIVDKREKHLKKHRDGHREKKDVKEQEELRKREIKR